MENNQEERKDTTHDDTIRMRELREFTERLTDEDLEKIRKAEKKRKGISGLFGRLFHK
ncbi:MAG: hypothetical protein U0L49_01515 [Eubacterium sp.]|nr:hypothetical protein [Eubacterium sp.]